jgi:di/tricarboxylate transporter
VTYDIALLLGLILIAVVFFCFEWVSADVVGLGLLLTLMLTGLLPADKAFAGFGSDTVIMIIGLLIMTAALMKAGVVDIVGRFILRRVGKSMNLLLLAIMLAVALLSAFISNTAAAAFFVPVAIGIAAKAGIAPSRLLMPVAFAAILTSSVSLISTSTNMVVSGLMTNAGLKPMGMFELTPVGIPIAIVGLIYMFAVGRYLIPNRTAPGELIEEFGIRSYLTEVLVLPKSALAGKPLAAAALGADLDLTVLRIVRNKDQYLLPRRNMIVEAGDVLLVEGPRADVLKVKDTAGIEIKPDVKLSDPNLRSEDTALVEALVVPGSPLIGETLRDLKFRNRYRLQVLGLNRHGKNVLQKLSRIPFRVGDVLLIQGRKTNIPALKDEGMFSILGEIEEKRPDRLRALRTGLIFCGALALATFNVVSLPVAMLLGAFGTFAAKCVTPSDAYREVEWRAVILIASMLALGEAMTATGTAKYLAELVASGTAGLDPRWLLGGVFLLTVLLTQPMSNQAAAAVILPIAVHTAEQLQLNPRTFAMMIAVAASCSYLTPLEPACLMVYGPGRYRFSDFLRVGLPLVILLFAMALWLVPKYWPLVLPSAP